MQPHFQLTRSGSDTVFEWVADERVRAGANRVVMPDEAVSVDTTRAGTRVPTRLVETRFVKRAVSVGEALRVTVRVVGSARATTRITHGHAGLVDVAGGVRVTR